MSGFDELVPKRPEGPVQRYSASLFYRRGEAASRVIPDFLYSG